MSEAVIRVASVQMLPSTADPHANIERATRFAREAATKHHANVIIFPETTLTGYAKPRDKGPTLEDTRAIAETVPGPSTRHFAALAKELGVYIVWGLHEKREDKYYNSASLLSPKGETLGTYSKVHINKHEDIMGWTNGDRFRVWPCDIGGVKFNLGIMICFDREVPEAARCLTVLGADIIAIPQATGCTCVYPIHRDQLRVRAYENEVFIAMANWAGDDYKGHSMIIHPNGQTLKLGSKAEEILLSDLDINELARLRKNGIYGRHHRQPQAYCPLSML
jgi:predicted amidohydrolase